MERIKKILKDNRDDLLIAVGVALFAFTAFGFGRATAPAAVKAPLVVEELPILQAKLLAPQVEAGEYVASKNGSRYYPTDCNSANRIKEENRIFFGTEQEALDGGYTRAKTCLFLTSP